MKDSTEWTIIPPTKPGFYWRICISNNGRKEVHIVKVSVDKKQRPSYRSTAMIFGKNYIGYLYSVNPIPYPKTPDVNEFFNFNKG